MPAGCGSCGGSCWSRGANWPCGCDTAFRVSTIILMVAAVAGIAILAALIGHPQRFTVAPDHKRIRPRSSRARTPTSEPGSRPRWPAGGGRVGDRRARGCRQDDGHDQADRQEGQREDHPDAPGRFPPPPPAPGPRVSRPVPRAPPVPAPWPASSGIGGVRQRLEQDRRGDERPEDGRRPRRRGRQAHACQRIKGHDRRRAGEHGQGRRQPQRGPVGQGQGVVRIDRPECRRDRSGQVIHDPARRRPAGCPECRAARVRPGRGRADAFPTCSASWRRIHSGYSARNRPRIVDLLLGHRVVARRRGQVEHQRPPGEAIALRCADRDDDLHHHRRDQKRRTARHSRPRLERSFRRAARARRNRHRAARPPRPATRRDAPGRGPAGATPTRPGRPAARPRRRKATARAATRAAGTIASRSRSFCIRSC